MRTTDENNYIDLNIQTMTWKQQVKITIQDELYRIRREESMRK